MKCTIAIDRKTTIGNYKSDAPKELGILDQGIVGAAPKTSSDKVKANRGRIRRKLL